MPTSNKWRDNGVTGHYNTMNVQLALKAEGVSDLATYSSRPITSSIILGDYTKWCQSLIFLPFDYTYEGTEKILTLGNEDTGVTCYVPSTDHDMGYTLGQYHYTAKYNDFRDYEPYTELQIYLPFYGLTSVPIKDVLGKYIQFRLSVDFMTGQAVYTIGSSNTSVTSPNVPFYRGTDDTNTRIVSTIVFTLGTTIPLGSANMASVARNVAMGAVKAASMGASAYVVTSGGLGVTTTDSKTVFTRRNSATGRQIKAVTKTTHTEHDSSNYQKARAVNGCFEVASDTLANINVNATTERPNNPFADSFGCKSIVIIRRTARVSNAGLEYDALYGRPLGETRVLSNVHGYTEISAIHFEGAGFNSATAKEKAMLGDAFSDGVILP